MPIIFNPSMTTVIAAATTAFAAATPAIAAADGYGRGYR
jgi:hypothetical protein